ncbi:Hypothetical protein POVR2_LOCUS249 [uncultured virus]|nr:Hypothetical protein POVR2_LOCUS249 [uncultured virus]
MRLGSTLFRIAMECDYLPCIQALLKLKMTIVDANKILRDAIFEARYEVAHLLLDDIRFIEQLDETVLQAVPKYYGDIA